MKDLSKYEYTIYILVKNYIKLGNFALSIFIFYSKDFQFIYI